MYGNNTNHTQILKIININIFPYTFFGIQNCWENIFYRPEETMFDNWQKFVSANKIYSVPEKYLTTWKSVVTNKFFQQLDSNSLVYRETN